MDDNHKKYLEGMKKAARAMLKGETTQKTVLNKLGLLGEGDIKKEIVALKSPANSPATIEHKGSSNPLIDTGEMLSSVTHKVEQ